jgi:hypothetical protein
MATPASAAQPMDDRVIMIIRHAEKPLHPVRSPYGVTPHGQEDPHSLTVTGWTRAGALAQLLAPAHAHPPPGLRRPDAIYASAHAGGHSKRSIQTVSPLAARLDLTIVDRYGVGDEPHLAEEVGNRAGATLIAWHHEAINSIWEHLGPVDPPPPDHWPPDRFDVIWTFSAEDHGWRFAQVPQLLLPGDVPHPIAARSPTG